MKLLVFSNSMPGLDAEFNDWYSNEHMQHMLEVPSVIEGRRYRLRPMETRGAGGQLQHDYLAIYEIEGDADADEVLAEVVKRREVGGYAISDALDPNTILAAFEEISE
jgi:hypothetical protein